MSVVVRILGLSLLTGGVVAMFGMMMLQQYPDGGAVCLGLACVGALIGVVAASAHEISTALRQRTSD